MKMVKSLLLGSAAGLVAVAGAQAADLPVKAKPVEYVKVCSIYGAGFWYIPGTDTCIKLGGWVRWEVGFGGAGNSHVPPIIGGGGVNSRGTNDSPWRARWVLSTDVRTQTEYGTLRAYIRAGYQTTTGESTQGRIYTERGFIQFAGFTLGKSQSYFDFFGGAFCYGCGYLGNSSQTGAAGTLLAAYTASLGNGITATVSLEDSFMRRAALYDRSAEAANLLAIGTMPGPLTVADSYNIVPFGIGDYAGVQLPHLVGALRVDQAWGSAQIAGAVGQVRSNWYGVNTAAGGGAAVIAATGAASGQIAPEDEVGFAVMGGLVLNAPMIGAGDRFYVEATYTQGMLGYVGLSGSVVGTTNNFVRFNGANVAAAWAFDGVFGVNPAATGGGLSGLQLTDAWAVAAAFEHYWTPNLRSSLWGSYTSVDYNGTASALICAGAPFANATGAVLVGDVAVGCNPDFEVWGIGLRTIWNPVRNLDVGLEVMYAKVDTAHAAGTPMAFGGSASGGRAAGTYGASSEDTWSALFRVQRYFWP
jgi:Porin subfamily